MLGFAACLLLLPGQIETIESADFSAKAQTAALTATVRIRNLEVMAEGSGIILGRKGGFVYILTAQHVIAKTKRLEIATFTAASYPRPARVYHSCVVVAQTNDLRDLALVRMVTDDKMPGSLPLCPARLAPDEKDFKALTVGCAADKPPTCLLETVGGKKRIRRQAEEEPAAFWEVGTENPEGRSGGPLVDKRGLLIGVCSGVNKDKAYFCHIDEINAFLERNGFDWLK
jgi:Trypsin-like peptidase domain